MSEIHTVVLAQRIDQVCLATWPSRAAQERLFDLGERKPWSMEQRAVVLQEVARWLREQLALCVENWKDAGAPIDWPELQRVGVELCPPNHAGGVARWAAGLAPALGVSPKRLANLRSRPSGPSNRAMRWLAVFDRVRRGAGDLDAWIYHRRTAACVSDALSTASDQPDAGDALLVASLLALWQRRRPTEKVRGNRGEAAPRRTTPKTIVGLQSEFIAPGQLSAIGRLARLMNNGALVELALEAALMEAHLAPHPRHRAADEVDSGEPWLSAAEALMSDVPALVTDAPVWRFRIERLRAYRDRRRSTQAEPGSLSHPYVAACTAISTLWAGGPVEPVDADRPGVLMLRPQLRALDLLRRTR